VLTTITNRTSYGLLKILKKEKIKITLNNLKLMPGLYFVDFIAGKRGYQPIINEKEVFHFNVLEGIVDHVVEHPFLPGSIFLDSTWVSLAE
jgi:hypothetical protein